MAIKFPTARLLAAFAFAGFALATLVEPAQAQQNLRSGSSSGAVAQIINDYTGAQMGTSGRSTVTQRFAPQVIAPTIAPASGCERPMSGGVSFIGTGITAGTSAAIIRCYAMEGGRVYAATFGQDAGFAYSCRLDSDFRLAMADIGRPCPQDRPAVAAVPVAAEASFGPPLVSLTPPNSRVQRPAYCDAMAARGTPVANAECRG